MLTRETRAPKGTIGLDLKSATIVEPLARRELTRVNTPRPLLPAAGGAMRRTGGRREQPSWSRDAQVGSEMLKQMGLESPSARCAGRHVDYYIDRKSILLFCSMSSYPNLFQVGVERG